MKIEEIYLIINAFFLGQLSAVIDAYYWLNAPMPNVSHPFNILNFFSLVFWGFAIYFTLKYTGLICRKKRKKK